MSEDDICGYGKQALRNDWSEEEFDQDSDYEGMLGTAVYEIIKVFAQQGHSGASAEIVT